MYDWYQTAVYVLHEAICRHTFSKCTNVHLCKICDCVVLTGKMLFQFALIEKLNLYMYHNVVYYQRKNCYNHR